MARPRIGICTAIERARWSYWDTEAYLLDRNYVDAVQAAGGIALMLPPDAEADPDEILDVLDGLILAGGADIDPATYGAEPHAMTSGMRPERDAFEIALAGRALERDIPFLGICRGMQVMNVARGGTLRQHLPDEVGHEDHRRTPGSFDGADHDVRLADASLAARAAGEVDHATKSHHHQGIAALGERLRRDRLEHARRAARGDRGPGAAVRAGRAVAPGGGPDVAPHRGAGGGGGTSTRVSLRSGTVRGSVERSNASRPPAAAKSPRIASK